MSNDMATAIVGGCITLLAAILFKWRGSGKPGVPAVPDAAADEDVDTHAVVTAVAAAGPGALSRDPDVVAFVVKQVAKAVVTLEHKHDALVLANAEMSARIGVQADQLAEQAAQLKTLNRARGVLWRRLREIEHIAIHSDDPPPRIMPDWPDAPIAAG